MKALPILYPIHSVPWVRNVWACRGKEAGDGTGCHLYCRFRDECLRDGVEVNSHAMRGTCPTGRMPYSLNQQRGQERRSVPMGARDEH